MNDPILRVLILFPVFLFSLCVHEFAHAWVANLRGDPTARLSGRLTIHPLAHADFMGTIMLPLLCLFSGWPVFGWAKPVPVDGGKLKSGRRDMALVAAAGPFSNVILAVLATAVVGSLIRVPPSFLPDQTAAFETILLMASIAVQANLMLAVFNLLPVPPLDGFMVLQAALPARFAFRLYQFSRFAALGLIAFYLTGGISFLSAPVHWGFRFLMSSVGVN